MTDARPLFSPAPQAVLDAVAQKAPKARAIVKDAFDFSVCSPHARDQDRAERVNDGLSAAAQVAAEAVAEVCRLAAKIKERPLGITASVMLVDIDMRARGIIIRETRG